VTGLAAARRQLEQRPVFGTRIVLRDFVRAPKVVFFVHADLIRLVRFRIRERDERGFFGLDVDFGERAAEGVPDVDVIAVFENPDLGQTLSGP